MELAVYTAKQVAKVLGVSDSRVRQFILLGRLRGKKVAGAWFVDGKEVARFRKLSRASGRPKNP